MRTTLIVHERLARWARRLRPRIESWRSRIVETRSTEELSKAAGRTSSPVVLIDLPSRPREILDAILAIRFQAPQALILAIDPTDPVELRLAAREAGATMVVGPSCPFPTVLGLIGDWLELSAGRNEADGWAPDRRVEPEPWEAHLAGGDPFFTTLGRV